MDSQDGLGYGSGQKTYAVDRRTGIVSGQMYGTQDFPPGEVNARRSNASSTKPSWENGFARYKAYTVEGKVKSTLKNGFRWIKNKCSHIVHGF
ncbi:hypothetical protein CARUB_v10025450mg [Capsella rubella]|uniref:DUF3511 domain-containing protein n=1 Tax=Capsella rubella TaxID=81985 RepID=R0HYL3_9BRAS|nr:hypothetical protein CARUB_v10025450mg [Capsella rubella]